MREWAKFLPRHPRIVLRKAFDVWQRPSFFSLAMKPDIRAHIWRVLLHADDAGESLHDFPMDGGDEKSNPGRRTASPTFLSLLYRRRRSQNKGTFASGEQNDLSRLNSVSKVRLSDDLVSISVKLL